MLSIHDIAAIATVKPRLTAIWDDVGNEVGRIGTVWHRSLFDLAIPHGAHIYLPIHDSAAVAAIKPGFAAVWYFELRGRD